jgi:hypothetical protein
MTMHIIISQYLLKHYAIKYAGVEMQLHAFLASALHLK